MFCGAPHPDNPILNEDTPPDAEFVFCRRLKGHSTRADNPVRSHAAFKHSIAVPEEWDDPVDLDYDDPPF